MNQWLLRPVVCSKIDAIPEALSHGVEGFLVPPGNSEAIRDAVLQLYESPELRKQMGAAGRARVLKQFSYERMGERYRELLDTVGLPGTLQNQVLKGKTVLVDMDNTIVDWDGEFIRRYSEASGQDPLEVEEMVRNRQKFEIEENFEASEHAKVLEVIASPGFYESLKPLPGAVEALQKMVEEGVDVKLVTAPHPLCAGSCAREKFISVERLLGPAFLERLPKGNSKVLALGRWVRLPCFALQFPKPAAVKQRTQICHGCVNSMYTPCCFWQISWLL